MKNKYRSEDFIQLYNQISALFKQEGNCYETILRSIEEGYEHGMISNQMSLPVIKGVLDDVVTDYYASKIKVLHEKQIINKYEV